LGNDAEIVGEPQPGDSIAALKDAPS